MAINPVNSSAAQHLQQSSPGHLDQLLLQARQARQGQNDQTGKTVGSIIDIHV